MQTAYIFSRECLHPVAQCGIRGISLVVDLLNFLSKDVCLYIFFEPLHALEDIGLRVGFALLGFFGFLGVSLICWGGSWIFLV